MELIGFIKKVGKLKSFKFNQKVQQKKAPRRIELRFPSFYVPKDVKLGWCTNHYTKGC